MLRLPRAEVLDRLALQIADVDVVEKRLDLEGNVAARERDQRRLARPVEARVDAEADRDVRDLLTEVLSVRPSFFRQVDAYAGVPVDPLFDVERGLSVPRHQEETHRRAA